MEFTKGIPHRMSFQSTFEQQKNHHTCLSICSLSQFSPPIFLQISIVVCSVNSNFHFERHFPIKMIESTRKWKRKDKQEHKVTKINRFYWIRKRKSKLLNRKVKNNGKWNQHKRWQAEAGKREKNKKNGNTKLTKKKGRKIMAEIYFMLFNINFHTSIFPFSLHACVKQQWNDDIGNYAKHGLLLK